MTGQTRIKGRVLQKVFTGDDLTRRDVDLGVAAIQLGAAPAEPRSRVLGFVFETVTIGDVPQWPDHDAPLLRRFLNQLRRVKEGGTLTMLLGSPTVWVTTNADLLRNAAHYFNLKEY